MPYMSEHAARIMDPGKFEDNSFRRKQIAPGISIILGKKMGESSMMAQAYRFDKSKYTEAEAKAWLKDHDISYTDFEPAREDMKDDNILELKLETIDLPEMEVFEAGEWKGHKFTESDIDEIIANFKNKVAEPYISLDHNPGLTENIRKLLDASGLGFAASMRRSGKKLLMSFKQVPKLIGEMIMAGTLKKRSVEVWKTFKHANGKQMRNVVQAVTFFGGNGLPAISTLAEIPALYQSYRADGVEGDLCIIEFKSDDKESKNMDKIEIGKDEYTDLLKAKATLEIVQAKLDASDKVLIQLKADVEKQSTERESLLKLKADVEKAQANAISAEAVSFCDGLIKDLKLKPAYKDMQVSQYIALKNSGDAKALESFKAFLSDQPKVVSDQSATGQGGVDSGTEKIQFKNEKDAAERGIAVMADLNARIEAHAAKTGKSLYEAGIELGLYK